MAGCGPIDQTMSKKQPRVPVSRDGKVFAEYASLQLPSLLETGHLKPDDHCYDASSGAWVPLEVYAKGVSGFLRKKTPSEAPEALETPDPPAEEPSPVGAFAPWLLALLALAVAVGAALFAWIQSGEISSLKGRLAAAEDSRASLQKQYDEALLTSREVSAKDIVRGRAIVRDANGKRVAAPGIKVRLFSRKTIESHLEAREQEITPETGSSPSQLAAHYIRGLPTPIETTSTDSDGRFEFHVPEPGDYVVQSSLISAKTREMRLWFVSFNSRDPLNTPVDLEDSNVVRQFSPLLMLSEGR